MTTHLRIHALFAVVLLLNFRPGPIPKLIAASDSFSPVIRQVQPKIVKIYGAGGVRGLEGYQSGFLVSAQGHILTAWSTVLDTDVVTAVLNDGRRFTADLVGADLRLEAALLKIDATDLPHFPLRETKKVEPGTRVLAFSNLFSVASGDEPASVQHGVIAATTQLKARRGTFATPYEGPVYVLDAVTNNPGAAGGVLTTWQGNFVGMLGKELRNVRNNTWLNYAVPGEILQESIQHILANDASVLPETERIRPDHPLSLAMLGIVLVPDVLDNTPAFIDSVYSGSPSDIAKVRPDDLLLYINDTLIQSAEDAKNQIRWIAEDGSVSLTVMRGKQLLQFDLRIKP